MNMTLKGRIIECFGSVLKFAEKIGWSHRKAYDIVNGKQEPTARDIENMAEILCVTIPDELHALFFR